MSIDLTKFGGKPILPVGARSLIEVAPEDVGYNFGVIPNFDGRMQAAQAGPSLHSKYPHMAGAWDGKITVNHCDAALKVFGGDTKKLEALIQQQPRGTCGGRAGSVTIDFVQLIMMAAGKRAKFHRTSHAAVYYLARHLYGWTGKGNWLNDDDDGVAGGSVPDALKKFGVTHREESDDPNYYGEGSDDVACKLVCGNLPELERRILTEAADNPVTEWVKVSNAQELADGIASGGFGLGSDMQGFTMTRDRNGFCTPRGTWSHYQTRVSVLGTNDYPQQGFGYWQSWGKGTPSGPALKGHPGNCFGVEKSVQDRVIKSGQWVVVFGFPLWEMDTTPVVPWIFGR